MVLLQRFWIANCVRSKDVLRRFAVMAAEQAQENIKVILDEVNRLAAGRECRLVAVSKTKPADLIKACYDVGQRHFGENYVQELEEKANSLKDACPNICWHYIGQIQSNKICAIPNLWCIETVENEKHALIVEKEMIKRDSTVRVLLQVNTSGEDQKGGVNVADAVELAKKINDLPHVLFSGFMTIGSFESSQQSPNPDFDVLARLRRVQWNKSFCARTLNGNVRRLRNSDTTRKYEQMITSGWSVPLRELASTPAKVQEKKDEHFRTLSLKCGVFEEKRGSAYAEFGQTKVLAVIHGPREPKDETNTAEGQVVVSASGNENLEFPLQRALSSVIRVEQYAASEVEVEVRIMECGGGELAVALVASSLALVHAGIHVHDLVIAAHMISVDGRFILDPPLPLPPGSVSLTVAFLPSLKQIVSCQQKGCLTVEEFDLAVEFARQYSAALYPIMRRAISNTVI